MRHALRTKFAYTGYIVYPILTQLSKESHVSTNQIFASAFVCVNAYVAI